MTTQSIKYPTIAELLRKINFSNKPGFKRIAEPVLLGCMANIVVGLMLNPHSFQFLPDEFITACILAIPITELNRYIDKRLEKKINWIQYPVKRFTTHLLLISLCLLVSLNLLGNGYMWVTQKGFFSWKEAGIINLVTLCLTIFLTFVNWATHFYSRWMGAETLASESARLVNDLSQKITQTEQFIHIQKGTSKIKTAVKNIRIAKIEFGITHIYCDSGEYGFFQGTISQLNTLLPGHLFFQVTRDSIVHREVIKSIASSSFGKIQLIINEPKAGSSACTVSRPRAAAFRKWYNSIST